MAKRTNSSLGDGGHPETAPEFNRRVQDQMDREAFVGRDDVGACFPTPGIVHEYPSFDAEPHIYRERKK